MVVEIDRSSAYRIYTVKIRIRISIYLCICKSLRINVSFVLIKTVT